MIGLILYLLVFGAIAGYIARLLVPGPDKIGFLRTVVLGIVGSFIGGFLGYVLFDHDFGEGAIQASGIIGSIIGAVIALLIYRAMTGGPRPPPAASRAAPAPRRPPARRRRPRRPCSRSSARQSRCPPSEGGRPQP